MQEMYGLNIELTTCCPLHCPQCYCTLQNGKHISLDVLKEKLVEASQHGVKMVHLSGGETLCYPQLYEAIQFASQYCGTVNVALSGWNFTCDVLNKLVNAGVSGIFISLNGSTEAINSLTRDGFDLAMQALTLLKSKQYNNTYINWVMHSNNADDFVNVIKIAEEYNVQHLVVLSFKPDSAHRMLTFPSSSQIHEVAEIIRNYTGSVNLMVESCFSQLLAIIKNTKLFGNLNVGSAKGCRAGLYNYCINVDGDYSPCRHLDYCESFQDLDSYLEKSEIIQKIRLVETKKRKPCSMCRYEKFCKPCLAVSSKLHNDIFIGHEICSLWK